MDEFGGGEAVVEFDEVEVLGADVAARAVCVCLLAAMVLEIGGRG